MNTQKDTILILDNSPSITGAYKSILSATEALQDKYTFIFALQSSQLASVFSNQKNAAIHLPFLEIQKSWKLLFYFPVLMINSFRLLKIIKKQHVRIIHINDLYNMCGIIVKILNPRIKLIYHIRLLPTSYAKRLYSIWKRLIEKYADEIICVSETVASNFSKKRTTVIFDSIDFAKPIENIDLDQKSNKFTILYLANYVSGKGHKQAIEAFNKVFRLLNNAQLLFFGGTLDKHKNEQFKERLVNYADELGLTKHITFNSFAENPEQEVTKADLMLNFSESESFSMTTLEALVYGTPIIVTECGGPSEIVEHTKSGLLVPVNNITAMAEAIVKLANDLDLRNSIIINGKERVLSKFEFSNQVALLRKVYLRLLNNSQLN